MLCTLSLMRTTLIRPCLDEGVVGHIYGVCLDPRPSVGRFSDILSMPWSFQLDFYPHLSTTDDFRFEMLENADSYMSETETYMRPLVNRNYASSWNMVCALDFLCEGCTL